MRKNHESVLWVVEITYRDHQMPYWVFRTRSAARQWVWQRKRLMEHKAYRFRVLQGQWGPDNIKEKS